MPTNYTGDPVGSNSPSPVPGPENFPIVAIPIATEGRTVSSIAQAFKTLGDHIAWLKKPFGSTSTAQRFQQRWRTAVGHTRFALDRNGLPAGTYLQRQEYWGVVSGLSGTPTGSPLPLLPWTKVCGATASGLVIVTPAGIINGTTPTERTGILLIAAGDVINQFYGVQGWPLCTFHAEADIAQEWVSCIDDSVSATRPDLILGITNPVTTDPRTVQGVYFLRDITKPNWQAIARDGSGETVVDTGVAISAGSSLNRFGVQFRGANVNDGAAKGAYFYIGGNLVATIAANVPTGGPAASLFAAKNTVGSVILRNGFGDMYVGPVNLASNFLPAVTT